MDVTFGKLKLSDGSSWVIDARPHVLIRIKRMFERSIKQSGAMWIKSTDEVCRDLQWLLTRYPLEMNDTDRRYLAYHAREYDKHVAQFEGLVSGAIDPRNFDLALPLRDYQRVAADLALRTHGLLIADEVGLGKTCMGIAMLCEKATRPALIVTLTHLPQQWEREIKKFAPSLVVHIIKKGRYYPVDKPPGRRDFLKPKRVYPDVLISNYHKLAGWADHLAGKVSTVIFDEVHELRRMDSAKAEAARAIAEKAEYRCGLSATPIMNYGNEFWNVIDVLRPGVLGTRDEFLREWCINVRNGEKASIDDPQAFGTYLREQGIMLRRTRKDVARELPDLVKIPHHIDCNMKVLNDAQDETAELARVILAQDTAWDARGRATRDFDLKMRQATGISKAPHAADFVKLLVESGEPVVVFLWHRDVYSILMDRLKEYNPVMYSGSESSKEKEESFKKFMSGESRVMLMSLRSGAGLDGLQEACHICVFAELDWSPAVHVQAAGRLHRDGVKGSVMAYYLIADEGSDPIVSDVLGIKRQQIEGVINPEGDLVEQLTIDEDHIKRLAQAYLEKTRGKKAVVAEAEEQEDDGEDGTEAEGSDENENGGEGAEAEKDDAAPPQDNVIPLRQLTSAANDEPTEETDETVEADDEAKDEG